MTTTALAPRPIEALTPAAVLSQSPAAVYLARLGSPNSRRTMGGCLREIVGMLTGGRQADTSEALLFPWQDLRYQHTQLVRTLLAERHAPAGANVAIAALRGVLREAWRLGLMGAEDYHRAADLACVRGERLPRGRALSAGEVRALFAVCAQDLSPAGARDAALLGVLYGCGLRRSEAIALEVADYTAATGELRVLHAKGNKQRIVHVTGGATLALADWLALRGPAPGALFCPVNHGGAIEVRPMTPQVCRWVLLKRTKEAGVAACAPHDLRRTFVGDALDAGVDVSIAQKMCGHANVQTTARYDRRPEAAKAAGFSKVFVPYVRARRGEAPFR